MNGLGLVIYALTGTVAAIDWSMSLDPHWFSTIYGLLILAGQVLGALALVYVTLGMLHRWAADTLDLPQQFLRDLGHLLLTAVMGWAYLAFAQYLIIWAANLPEEITWVMHRLAGGWVWVGLAIVVLNFAVPFGMLLSPENKRRLDRLAVIGGVILFARLLDGVWMVTPSFYGDGIQLHWQDLAVLVGIGGVWLALYVQTLKVHPLWSQADVHTLVVRGQESQEERSEHV